MAWRLTRKASYTNQNEGCTPCKGIIELREALGNYVNVVTGAHNLRINNLEETLGNITALNSGSGIFCNIKCGVGTTNTAMGYQALNLEKGGDKGNTAMGYEALTSLNQFAVQNTAVGAGALTQVGAGAGEAAGHNTAMGFQALSQLGGPGGPSGPMLNEGNTALGWSAGNSLATGQNNIYIGSNADTYIEDASANYEIVIGSDASGNGSYTTTIGNSSTTETYIYGNLHSIGDIHSDGRVSGNINIARVAHSPPKINDTGKKGDIRFDDNFVYICTNDNTWKRAAISTWGG